MYQDIDITNLIILGLTGPVGSGCTTLSRIFDDDEKNVNREIAQCDLLTFLIDKERYLSIDEEDESLIVEHESIDGKIKILFEKLAELDNQIKQFNENYDSAQKMWFENADYTVGNEPMNLPNGQLEIYLDLKKITFDKLKDLLETRETLKALDEIDRFIDFRKKKHHFRRISMSDLIIFEALISKNDNVENGEQKIKVDKFQEITRRENFRKKIHDIEKHINHLDPEAVHLKDLKALLDSKVATQGNSDGLAQILQKTVTLIRSIKSEFKSHGDYRLIMQDFGDNIRRNGNPFDYSRKMDPDKTPNTMIHQTLASDAELLIKFLFETREHSFFIIDSFRNPYEAFYFKNRYVNFYLISVHAPRDMREKRLGDKFDEKSEKRDQGGFIKEIEDHFYMQNVPKTVKCSDIAINNDKDLSANDEDLGNYKLIEKLIRYLALIFDTGCTKPNDDEVMMNLAYTMAMKSNCISRQVGAVIVGREGYVVGAGCNDVGEGKISCGLREIKDLKLPWYEERYAAMFDQPIDRVIESLVNDYQSGEFFDPEKAKKFCFCFKDQYSEKQLKTKLEKHRGWDELSGDCKEFINEEVSVKRLEYCQALHAEENAIIQTSKIGGMGLQGGKIYTTSAPCELCAKKIQQVGISDIIYTEPYPGISEQLFLRKAFSKIHVRQFEGVMPHSYFRLFKVREDQKEWQGMYNQGLVW